MDVKSIALIVFDLPEARWLLPQAARAARALGAHLTVLHAYRPVFVSEMVGPEPMIHATIEHWKDDASVPIRQIFVRDVAAPDLEAEFREYPHIFGGEDFLLAAGRAADLVVVGTNAVPARSRDDRSLMERLIRALGRPVLVLHPDAPCRLPLGRVVIGWSDTREAARAAHDVLALAAPGAVVRILSLVAGVGDQPPAIDARGDFAAAIRRRGLTAIVDERQADAPDRAAALIDATRDWDADAIAVGAFGHSAVYDFVIGAVTRDLLAASHVPLLMSR